MPSLVGRESEQAEIGCALDLPLKLLIHEDVDGRGFVSYNEPSYLAQRYGLTDDEADGLRVVETIARTMRNTA